jgi:hypothetical protein
MDRMLGSSIEKMFKTQTRKTILNNFLRGAGIEGSTEVSQEILKYFDDYKDSKTPEERQIAIE